MPVPILENTTGITKLTDLDGDKLVPFLDAFSFNFSGAGTKTTTYKIPNNLMIVSAEGIFINASSGDYIRIDIIDIDNILGFGANTILLTPVNKFFVSTEASKERITLGYPKIAQKDLYIKLTYESTNALAVNVAARLNIIAHKLL